MFTAAIASCVPTGMANSLQGLAIRNLIHNRVPPEVRRRAFIFSDAALNGANLTGIALGGPAAGQLGGVGALQLAGVGTLVVSLIAVPVLARAPQTAMGAEGPAGRETLRGRWTRMRDLGEAVKNA
ncbi:hypothetical protein [Streptomyces sp. WZ-12]|uniref:hypothetical protein n=1 Tax=Streptomyces sp. WZ-12 TaxID=3030210 RepID=UPI002380E4D1|nr:hypothetical protein [Streptomyces sp. WZ-12]